MAAYRSRPSRLEVATVRRFVSLVLVFALVFSLGGFSAPAPASANPAAILLGSYTAYQAAVAAAGLSYAGATGATLTGAGVTPRQAYSLQSLMIHNGEMSLATAGSMLAPGILMAKHAFMVAQGLWDSWSNAVNGAFAAGGYAWYQLTHPAATYMGVQTAPVAGVSYTGTTYALPSEKQWANVVNAAGWAAASAGGKSWDSTADRGKALAIITMWTLCGSQAYLNLNASGFFAGYAAQGGQWGAKLQGDVGYGYFAVYVSALYGIYGSGAFVATYNALSAKTVTTDVGSQISEAFQESMPTDPFPGAPWGDGPHWQAVPLPWLSKAISDIGTPNGTGTTPGTIIPTPDTPPPFEPGTTTPHDPLPPPGTTPGKLGDGAHTAATTLNGTVPTELAWLVAPFVGLLNGLGDILDFLQSCWNTVVAWVAGLIYPGADGMAIHWTQPWSDIRASFTGRWPFAGAAVVGAIFSPLFSPGMTGTHTLASTASLNFNGATWAFNLDSWLTPLVPFRWFFVAGIWLWFLVSVWRFWTPQVVT